MSQEPIKALSLEELPELRRKTEAVSRFLKDQIAAHLETLRPLFAPERILGKYAGGKSEVAGAERVLAELRQGYAPFISKPYDLPETFDQNWLTLIGNALELFPSEYAHQVQGKLITMTSPFRWVLNCRSNYSLGNVKSVLSGKEAVRQDYLRQFAINALFIQVMLARNPGLGRLLQDLGYELKIETTPDLRGLPMVTVNSSLASFRPADDLIIAATAFSGVPAFIELVDADALRQPTDPLQAQLEALMN